MKKLLGYLLIWIPAIIIVCISFMFSLYLIDTIGFSLIYAILAGVVLVGSINIGSKILDKAGK